MNLGKLDDSPMFRKQVQASEESAEALRERCQKFYKGCRKYTEGLGEAYDGDIAFASSLETFGGGHDDPISIAVGGPVMTKFTIALREIGTYKEVLRSQVEHMLNDRLMQFVNIDLQDAKEVRKRFDKATLHYDQVREKFMSLKKSTRIDIVTETEEDLRNARSAFEQARFNLVTALSNIEAKKKFEFLEAVSGTMDAHLRYFKQGYELLHQMEPYIHQVLTYAQQSRERTNYEQSALAERMQEFRKQIEQENQRSFSDVETSPSGDGIQAVGRSSHKMIEAVMQSTMKGKVQTIKQGYLLKRSSNLRGDWKRRFFVLDSRGMLYYYRKQWSKPAGPANQLSVQRAPHSSEHVTGLLGRLLSSHHGIPQEEKTVTHHTVNLLTSTIKVDAEQTDLRFCFRIISPTKNYTLQAENAVDRMDWIDKITAVIASLLNSQLPEQVGYSQRVPRSPRVGGHQGKNSDTNSWSSSSDLEQSMANEYASMRSYVPSRQDSVRGMQGHVAAEQQERPLDTLRKVPGNDVCADCGCPDPDWASLNLGILLCIECSGVHRNLGVHISKVRSLTLDVRVWELSVISLFQSLGNMYANSIWEELLESGKCNDDAHNRLDDHQQLADVMSINKPKPRDALSIKEKFIQAKYAEKQLVSKERSDMELPSVDFRMWEAVQRNDKQMAYRLLIMSDANIATNYEQAKSGSNGNSIDHNISESSCRESMQYSDSGTSSPSIETHWDDFSEIEGGLKGCSLLHLACHTGDLAMLELLLQYGADVNIQDYYGRTPLHHCISKGNNQYAKLLIRRGASAMIADGRGKTPLQRAMEMGAMPPAETSYFVAGVPGSFHNRLFPLNTLHFVHSSYGLHWLSRVPPEVEDKNSKCWNKGRIYISEQGPAGVVDAYFAQFQKDFNGFLRARAKEMVKEGRMFLVVNGRLSADRRRLGTAAVYWDWLGFAIKDLVSQKFIEEEKLDSFNIPYYAASSDELRSEVHKEGSFTIVGLEVIVGHSNIEKHDNNDKGRFISKQIRAISESLISYHFGEEMVDAIFNRYAEILATNIMQIEELLKQSTKIALTLERTIST